MPLAEHVPLGHRIGGLTVPTKPLIELTPDLSTTQALDVIVRACGQQVLDRVDPVLTTRDARSLHEMRVALRRLRAAFSLLRRPLGDGEKLAWVSTETRDLAAPLGRARDIDVAVRDHLERLTGSPHRKLLALREDAYDEVVDVVGSDRWRDLSTHMDRFLKRLHDEVPVDPPVTEAANEALDRRFRRVTERGARLGRSKPAERHRVRIDAKKLRYGSQFFAGLYAVPSGPDAPSTSAVVDFTRSVATLQDSLGELRDIQTTRHLLESVGATVPDVDTKPLLDRAIASHADIVSRGPFWTAPPR
ncbi:MULTISPECIES: CHAD domain-containing protein [unclassified Knoellia]|uniref:CHAD domain-containing protein n=1 Tax=Knoellia altitudinis TaxID=3404795 RepID=UPI00360ECA8F